MRKLLESEVVPRLAARASGDVVRSMVVRTTAIPESTLAERMGDIEREIAPLTMAYLPGIEGVDLRLTAWGMQPAEADRRLRSAADLARERAGEHVYGEGEADLAAILLEQARRAGVSLGAAESCTGGLVGGRITAIPGSSDVLRRRGRVLLQRAQDDAAGRAGRPHRPARSGERGGRAGHGGGRSHPPWRGHGDLRHRHRRARPVAPRKSPWAPSGSACPPRVAPRPSG